ncbi:UNVERIFIED_CONTAM: hypothetical protein RMT77_016954 [Armadillidium vulgare]
MLNANDIYKWVGGECQYPHTTPSLESANNTHIWGARNDFTFKYISYLKLKSKLVLLIDSLLPTIFVC